MCLRTEVIISVVSESKKSCLLIILSSWLLVRVDEILSTFGIFFVEYPSLF